MAAPIKAHRTLAAEVRTLTLTKIKGILETSDEDLKKDMHLKALHDGLLLKLSGSVLPRLNEVTGEDGASISIHFDPAFKNIIGGVTQPTEANSPSAEQI